jgi:hypothetical protein
MLFSTRIVRQLSVPLVACGLLALTGCGDEPANPKKTTATQGGSGAAHDHDHDHGEGEGHHHHHHAEKGPHNGALVALGHDDAHLEFVLNAETGTLTAYVLDGAAEKPVAIHQKNIQLALSVDDHDHKEGEEKEGDKHDELPDDAVQLLLAAVSPTDDGTATEFAGQLDQLKGVAKFEAAITAIKVGDKEFSGINFKYPEGNEDHHHH